MLEHETLEYNMFSAELMAAAAMELLAPTRYGCVAGEPRIRSGRGGGRGRARGRARRGRSRASRPSVSKHVSERTSAGYDPEDDVKKQQKSRIIQGNDHEHDSEDAETTKEAGAADDAAGGETKDVRPGGKVEAVLLEMGGAGVEHEDEKEGLKMELYDGEHHEEEGEGVEEVEEVDEDRKEDDDDIYDESEVSEESEVEYVAVNLRAAEGRRRGGEVSERHLDRRLHDDDIMADGHLLLSSPFDAASENLKAGHDVVALSTDLAAAGIVRDAMSLTAVTADSIVAHACDADRGYHTGLSSDSELSDSWDVDYASQDQSLPGEGGRVVVYGEKWRERRKKERVRRKQAHARHGAAAAQHARRERGRQRLRRIRRGPRMPHAPVFAQRDPRRTAHNGFPSGYDYRSPLGELVQWGNRPEDKRRVVALDARAIGRGSVVLVQYPERYLDGGGVHVHDINATVQARGLTCDGKLRREVIASRGDKGEQNERFALRLGFVVERVRSKQVGAEQSVTEEADMSDLISLHFLIPKTEEVGKELFKHYLRYMVCQHRCERYKRALKGRERDAIKEMKRAVHMEDLLGSSLRDEVTRLEGILAKPCVTDQQRKKDGEITDQVGVARQLPVSLRHFVPGGHALAPVPMSRVVCRFPLHVDDVRQPSSLSVLHGFHRRCRGPEMTKRGRETSVFAHGVPISARCGGEDEECDMSPQPLVGKAKKKQVKKEVIIGAEGRLSGDDKGGELNRGTTRDQLLRASNLEESELHALRQAARVGQGGVASAILHPSHGIKKDSNVSSMSSVIPLYHVDEDIVGPGCMTVHCDANRHTEASVFERLPNPVGIMENGGPRFVPYFHAQYHGEDSHLCLDNHSRRLVARPAAGNSFMLTGDNDCFTTSFAKNVRMNRSGDGGVNAAELVLRKAAGGEADDAGKPLWFQPVADDASHGITKSLSSYEKPAAASTSDGDLATTAITSGSAPTDYFPVCHRETVDLFIDAHRKVRQRFLTGSFL